MVLLYDEKNCPSYLINVKECQNNRLLKYGVYNKEFRGKLFKNENSDVIFFILRRNELFFQFYFFKLHIII